MKYVSDEKFAAEIIMKLEKDGVEGCFEYPDYNDTTDHYVDVSLKRDRSA